MDDFNSTPRLSKRDLFIVVFKRKKIFFSIFILTTLLVTIGAYVLPLPYITVAKLYVERAKSSTVPALMQASSQFLGREDVLISEIEILSSRTVAMRVTDQLGLHTKEPKNKFMNSLIKSIKEPIFALGLLDRPDPREGSISSLQKDIKVKSIPKSDILKITYIGDDPVLITEVVNTLIKTYLNRRLELFKSMRAEGFYDEQVALFKQKIEDLKKEERELKAKWSIGQISNDKEAVQKQIDDIKRELIIIDQDIVGIDSKTRELKQHLRYVAFNENKENYQIMNDMASNLLKFVAEKSRLEQELKPGSPAIVKLDNEIKRLQKSLIDSLNSVKEEFISRKNQYSSQIESLEERTQLLNEVESKLTRVTSAIPLTESTYERYFKLREDARLEEMGKADMVNVKVVDFANVPYKPIFPKIVFIFIGAFLSLITAYGYILLLEYFDHKVDTAESVTHFTKLQVFAVLPEVKK